MVTPGPTAGTTGFSGARFSPSFPRRRYCLRGLPGAEEAAAPAASHRRAFSHSSIAGDIYRRLMTSRHCGTKLDIVVAARDGELVSEALAWLDAASGIGEFEPAGTHPGDRRKKLVGAAMHEGLRRLRDCGASAAVVCAEAGERGIGRALSGSWLRHRRHVARFHRSDRGPLRHARHAAVPAFASFDTRFAGAEAQAQDEVYGRTAQHYPWRCHSHTNLILKRASRRTQTPLMQFRERAAPAAAR